MYFKILDKRSRDEVTEIFESAFTASEGETEGRLIGHLASELSFEIDNREILCFGACEGESISGSIFFTPLRFKADIEVYMLAPVAVRTEHNAESRRTRCGEPLRVRYVRTDPSKSSPLMFDVEPVPQLHQASWLLQIGHTCFLPISADISPLRNESKLLCE